MNDESLFTINQVSILLKVHPLTIRRYIKEGRLKAVKLGGNIRVSQSSIDNFSQDIYPTSYGLKKVIAHRDDRFNLDDSIFRLKGRGMSLRHVDF